EKANGKTVSPAARKPKKKSTGVGQRADKDRVALEAVEMPTLEASRAALERKARIYDKLRKGGSVSEKVAEELMVDFERKNWNDPEESDTSDDEKRSSGEGEDDPWVEYVDEFGRTRVVRKSQVPKEPTPPPVDDTLPTLLSEDMRRDLERQRWEREAEEELAAGPQHYDERREVRAKGVGFYRFSRDEGERSEQMSELKRLRNQTEARRMAHQSVKDRRKEILEKRTEMIRAKRRKIEGKEEEVEDVQVKGKGKGKEEEEVVETGARKDGIDEKAITDMLRSIRNKVA
ncbi:hypothetical protein BC938DRAFT_480971, partial [Jimgerdemannia flammicorona]